MIGEKIASEIVGLGRDIAGVVSEFVDDKDLGKQLAFALQQKLLDRSMSILTSESTPTGIKYMYAVRDVIVPMFRPVFGAYLTYKFGGDAITTAGELGAEHMLAGAFPAWMASRWHEKKQEKSKEERIQVIREKRAAHDQGLPPFLEGHD